MGIGRKEALECFRSDDLIGIGMEADAVRRSLHPDGIVSYVLDGTVSLATALANASFGEIEHILACGGTSVVLEGDSAPDLTLERVESLLRTIKERYPSLWLHGLSATVVLELAANSKASNFELTLPTIVRRLHEAGLDSIGGEDAGILDDAVQRQSRWKSADWISVHRAAHQAGLDSTASMAFGSGETFEHRVNHLEAIYRLQEETGGFASFTPRTFTAQGASRPGFEEATAVEYLKTLAVSRMYLDNIPNVQSNLETQGLKVLQVGLRFGGNDAGSVLQAKGPNAATEEQLRQAIRDAGFRPMQRDVLYRTMFLN